LSPYRTQMARKWICKTGSSCVLWPTFRQIESRGRWVRKTHRRHISTSGLASRAPGRLFFALFWPILSPYRTQMARNAFYKKIGCTKFKSLALKYSAETGSTFKCARNGPKCREIDRNSKNACKKSSWSNLKWICKTGSRCVLWPTFRQIESQARWVRKAGRRHISTSDLASRALWMLFFALFWPALSPYCTLTARNAFYKKTGCTNSKSVARKYSSETGSTFKSAQNCPKCREIDCNSKNACKKSSWSNL